MKLKGFPDLWCDWIIKVVKGGHVGVKVNDNIGPYFMTHKGLIQGDPLSPLLFDIVTDALSILVERAKEHGLIKGLVPEFVENGLAILQYAYDTIFLMLDDYEGAKNIKWILCLFEQMSSLKINCHKSNLYCFREAVPKQDKYCEILTCKMGTLPMKYLGIIMNKTRLRNKD